MSLLRIPNGRKVHAFLSQKYYKQTEKGESTTESTMIRVKKNDAQTLTYEEETNNSNVRFSPKAHQNEDGADMQPFFEFSSGGIPRIDKAYNLAMSEISSNIRRKDPNSNNLDDEENPEIFMAGSGWKELWTRDTSYSIELATGLIHPKISKASLYIVV